MDLLKIAATARGLNYLPEYYAESVGLFDQHGVKVTNEPKDPWTGVLDDLESGAADIALGGLWVPAMLSGMSRDVVAVGQLNACFPMVVVTRDTVPDFDWSWLAGKTVLVPGVGGTAPYEFTAGLIREAGLDPADTRFVRDLSTDLLRELFEGGLGDAMVADLTTATLLEHDGHGHMSCHLVDVGGPMPNSVYYVRRDRVDELRAPIASFLAAVDEAMTALTSSTPPDITGLLAQLWPDTPLAVLQSAAARLMGGDTWSGVRIEKDPTERWTGILHDAGLTSGKVSYDAIVDPSVAAAITS